MQLLQIILGSVLIVQAADFFGVPFIQQIDPKQSKYKSAFGGLITLLICSASLAYAIWVLYLWQSNQFSPKISNSIYVSDFQLLDLNYDVLKLYYWKVEENYIDPFESKLLLPLVMYTTNFSLTDLQVINMANETSADGSSKYIIPKMSLASQLINGELYIDYIIFFPLKKKIQKNYTKLNLKID